MYGGDGPLVGQMKFAYISNILKLSDVGNYFGKREWENITKNELKEFCAQENSHKILNGLKERAEAHQLIRTMMQQFDSGDMRRTMI